MKRTKINLFTLLLAVFSVSCHLPLNRTSFSYACPAERPDEKDLIGIWTPDETTLEDLRTRGKYDPSVSTKLIFRQDGSFEMVQMPNWWRASFGKSYGTFENAKGTWELATIGINCWGIRLDLGFLVADLSFHQSRSDGQPKFIILNVIGDPDEGHVMVFVREE